MSGAVPVVAPPRTAGELFRGLPGWVRQNLVRAVAAALVAGIMGYAANVWIMAVRYQGTQDVPPGAPATSSGNVLGGAMFWALASSVVFGIVGYRRAAGKERFWREARGLPGTLAGLARRDGAAGRVHLLWGAAVALLAGLFVPPALGAVTAVAVLATAPTVLGSIISSSLFRLWQSAARPLGPSAPRPPGIQSMVVGLVGSGLALSAGMLIADQTIRLVLAIAAAALALVLGKQIRPSTAAVVILVFGAATIAFDLLFATNAVADDGGLAECSGSWSEWLKQCSGSGAVRRDSIAGGIASAIGAPIGGFVGGIAGSFPPVDGLPPDDGGPPGAPPPRPPMPGFHPLVDPGSGEPMIYFDPALHGGGGRPGEVWWGGRWVDPNTPEFAQSFQENIDTIEELRAGHQMMEEFHRRNQVFEEQRREQIRAEQAAQRALAEQRQRAITEYGELVAKIGELPANERYNRVLESLDNHLYRADGTIDPAAVTRARGALFRLVSTDQAIPDSELRPNSVLRDVAETAVYTVKEVAPMVARAGLAYATAGVSEVGIQSYGMTRAMMESDTPFGTGGLANAAGYLARENLPVNSLAKLAQGEMPGLGDVSADALGALTHARTVGAGGSHLPGVFATVETGVNMTRAHVTVGEFYSIQHVANAHDAEIATRPFGPDRIPEGAGKPSTLSAKTVNAETAPFYPEVQRGGFAAGPPELPPNATPHQQAVYERLLNEYQVKTEPAVARLVEQGYTTNEHGQLFDPSGRPVTSDPDMLSFRHRDGPPLTADEAKAVTDDLRANPYSNVQHGQAAGPGGYVDYVREHGGSPAQIAEAQRLVAEWEARGPGAVWRPQQLGPAGSLVPAPAQPVAPSGTVGDQPTTRTDDRDLMADFYASKQATP